LNKFIKYGKKLGRMSTSDFIEEGIEATNNLVKENKAKMPDRIVM
jgi:hypothetical protein